MVPEAQHANLASPSQVRGLLSDLGIRPRRALGQNFLTDGNVLDILVRTLAPRANDVVLEIGAGLGLVTEALVERCGRVVAVEKDRRLHEYLCARFGRRPGLKLVCADMLDLDASDLMGRAWSAQVRAEGRDKVISNLPYSVGNRILMDLARSVCPPARIAVTVQEEVADRLSASEGSRDYGMISVWTGLVYEVEVVKIVSGNCFWPRPEVRSAIVRLDRRAGAGLGAGRRDVFYEVTRQAFTYRRKQLATALAGARHLKGLDSAGIRKLLFSLGIAEKARPEEVSVEQWCEIARALSSPLPPRSSPLES